jgi:hypothetical protein
VQDPAGFGDGSATAPRDTGSGYAPEQDPAYPEYGIAGATRAAL